MVQVIDTFDGGTDGSSAAATDSTVNASFFALNGGTAVYSTAARLGLSGVGLSFTSVSGSQSLGRWFPSASATQMSVSVGLSLTAVPSAEVTMLSFRGTSITVRWTASNTFRVYNGSTNLGVIAASLIPGTVYRIYLGVDTVAGTVGAAAYQGASSTPLSTALTVTGLSLASASITSFDIGVVTPIVGATTAYVDNLYMSNGSTNDPMQLPPTISHAETGSMCTIDFRGSVANGGGPLIFSISPSAGTSQPVAGLFLVSQTTSTQSFTVTTTDEGNGNSAATVVSVPAVSSTQNVLHIRTRAGGALV